MILLVLILIVSLTVTSSIFIYWLSASIVEADRPSAADKSSALRMFQHSKDVASLGARTAFVSIAVGDEARQFAVNMLHSLLHNGGARDCGAIVLLTDDVRHFDNVVRDDDALRASVRFVGVDTLPFQLPVVQRPKRVANGKRMSERRAKKLAIKWLKTQLFK